MFRIKATVVTVKDGRVRMHLTCSGRRDAEQLIEKLYPDHHYASLIVLAGERAR